MISFEDAFKIVVTSAEPLAAERIDFQKAAGRFLAEDVVSDTDMPPFNKSAVDGFACRKEDLSSELKIIETIAAGQIANKEIEKGTCSKIMTGAKVPDGADCVVMVEFSKIVQENFVSFTIDHTSENICKKGEDIKKGTVVLEKGTFLTPAHIAVLASVGCTMPLVSRKPRIAVFSTGDELLEPSEKLSGAKIRNSNSYQLVAQAEKCKADVTYYGIINDVEENLSEEIQKAESENDVIILTGGVSMGDFDFVPSILKKSGYDILFQSIAVQPGKPTVFAKKGKVYCFGLPGNPVSSFIQFELLVKPLLYNLSGCEFQPMDLNLPINENYYRKRAERLAIVPICIKDRKVHLISYHGSAHIHALTTANAVMFVPIGVTNFNKDTLVHVRPI